MTHLTPSSNRHNVRTFIANVLACTLLTSQLAPLAMAFNGPANRRAPAGTSDTELKKTSEAPPQGSVAGSFAPVPVPLRVTALGGGPITATKVDSFPDPDGDGKVSPGENITYSVTITNNTAGPLLNVTLDDTVDANTTLIGGSAVSTPIAFDDAYDVVGNVRIQPNAAQGLLANDINPNTGNNTDLTASGPTTSTQGGNVAINADGSFSYNPPAGFTGSDTFTYTVTSPNGTDTGLVTLTVGTAATVIWFVNATAPVGGDGRLTNPFNCYTGTNCFSDTAADDPGDSIFLFSGAYTGGYTLLTNERLIGQAASDTLANIAGVTVPAYSDALPGTGGASPTITTTAPATSAIPLGSGNHLRGFTVGNTTGTKISGNTFGTLTVGNNTTPDVILNGIGRALGLVTGTFAATSGFASVATTSSTAQGIQLTGVAGTVSFGSTTVSGSASQGIVVSTSTANINFGNTSVTGGTDGILLQNNSSGTRTFGTLSISNNSGVGFLHAVGGGNVNVTGTTSIPAAAQTAPVGTGIDIQSLAVGTSVTFAATNVGKGNAGTAVNLGGAATGNAGNVTFNSLAITTSNGPGLVGTGNTGQINVTTNAGSISTAGGPAINITKAAAPATPITLNFGMVDSVNSGTQGINLDRVSGNMTISSGTHTNPTGVGIQVQNTSAGGTMNFGNTNTSQSGATGVVLGGAASGNAGNVTFADLDILPDSGQRAFHATNNTGTISSTSGDIAATSNVTLEITGASAAARTPLTMVLNNLDSTNSTGIGVDLNFVSGNFTVNDATLATSISNPAGIGIRVQNTGAGAMNFGNTNVAASGGTGVVLGTAGNGNTGAITFADLDITPDSGQRAFHATSNTGAITSTSGTISTTNQTAVEIVGTAPANRTPLNVQLTSVSALASGGNPPNGIVLVSTSATGAPGGFRVLGSGGTCTFSTPTCTGGRITTTTGADNTPSGIGVRLVDANTVVLTRMRIDNHPNFAVRGTNVVGFTLDTSVIDGTNGTSITADDDTLANGEDSVRFTNLTGSAAITNCYIGGGFENVLRVINNTGILNRLTVSGSTIGGAAAGQGANSDDAIIVSATGIASPATVNFSLLNSTLSQAKGDIVQVASNQNATMDVVLRGNTISNNHPSIVSGVGGLTIGASNSPGQTATLTYDISCNKMQDAKGNAITLFKGGPGTTNMTGTVFNNRIGVTGVVGSASDDASGIQVDAQGSGTHTVLIKNNQIRRHNFAGISMQSGDGSATLNATVIGNFVAEPEGFGFAGFYAESGALPATDTIVLNLKLGGAGAEQNNFVDGDPSNFSDVQYSKIGAGTQFNLSRGVSGSNDPVVITQANNVAPITVFSAAGLTPVNTVPTLPPAVDETCTPPAAPKPGDEEKPDSRDDKGSPESVEQITAPTNTDSITSRPFISSPRQQPAVTGGTATAQVVARPRPVPATGSASAAPQIAGADTPAANPPVIVGNNLTWNVGTLPAGQSVTITFQVTVNTPPPTFTQVSNQGTVTADTIAPVLTDDPAVGGLSDPTVTGVTAPPDLFVRDASVAEPASGSTSMIFTLALSTPAPLGGIVVDLTTADGTATGGTCVAGDDYESVTDSTASFAAGEQIKTFPVTVCSDATAEGDETLFLNVNSAPGATIVDGQGLGTITANVAGTTLISELRTSGPGGAGDDFVEIYNNTDTPFTVPAGGYGLFKRGVDCNALPVLIGTIPAATVIPQRGHYLFVGSTYSLTAYAGGNMVLTTDIESDFNVGLFSTVDPLAISTANRLDAVGFIGSAGGICDVLREGTALPQASGSTSEYSFVREFTLFSNDVPTPTDGNDNFIDFTVLSTTPATPVGSTPAPRLGAPGPENLAGPNLKKFTQVGAQNIDPMLPASAQPNRFRDTAPDPANNSLLGTIAIRRTFTNNTGAPITRLRFRIYDITTFPSPMGTADLRARTSTNATVTVTGVGSVTALATTLETPPAQPNSGGLNSSLAAGTVTMGTPLAAGATIHLNFLFGVQQSGSFRVFVFVEALP